MLQHAPLSASPLLSEPPMTPITRAARALAKQQSGTDDYDALDPALQDALKDEVRAVLGAVREPSEGMADAGYVHYNEDEGPWRVFEAMIDAALTE